MVDYRVSGWTLAGLVPVVKGHELDDHGHWSFISLQLVRSKTDSRAVLEGLSSAFEADVATSTLAFRSSLKSLVFLGGDGKGLWTLLGLEKFSCWLCALGDGDFESVTSAADITRVNGDSCLRNWAADDCACAKRPCAHRRTQVRLFPSITVRVGPSHIIVTQCCYSVCL